MVMNLKRLKNTALDQWFPAGKLRHPRMPHGVARGTTFLWILALF